MASRKQALLQSRLSAQRRAPEDDNHVPSPTIMYGLLKAYADDLEQEGLDAVAKSLLSLSAAICAVEQLTQPTPMQVQPATDEEVKLNEEAMKTRKMADLEQSSLWQDDEKLCRLVSPPFSTDLIKSALKSYISVVRLVQVHEKEWALRVGDRWIVGGFHRKKDRYDKVNLPQGMPFSHEEQSAAVFGLNRSYGMVNKFVKQCQLEWAEAMIQEAAEKICKDKVEEGFSVQTRIEEVHVNFAFSPQINYAYHIDAPDLKCSPDFTVMVNLSPGKTSMHIAGAKNEAHYHIPGDAVLFGAQDIFHRSGAAQWRTLKLAFFVTISHDKPEVLELSDDDDVTEKDGNNIKDEPKPPPEEPHAGEQQQAQEQKLQEQERQEQEQQGQEPQRPEQGQGEGQAVVQGGSVGNKNENENPDGCDHQGQGDHAHDVEVLAAVAVPAPEAGGASSSGTVPPEFKELKIEVKKEPRSPSRSITKRQKTEK